MKHLLRLTLVIVSVLALTACDVVTPVKNAAGAVVGWIREKADVTVATSANGTPVKKQEANCGVVVEPPIPPGPTTVPPRANVAPYTAIDPIARLLPLAWWTACVLRTNYTTTLPVLKITGAPNWPADAQHPRYACVNMTVPRLNFSGRGECRWYAMKPAGWVSGRLAPIGWIADGLPNSYLGLTQFEVFNRAHVVAYY